MMKSCEIQMILIAKDSLLPFNNHIFLSYFQMPRVKTLTSRKPPAGWDQIEPTLKELTNQIKDVETMPFDGKRQPETVWKIYKLHHQRSRYIYETFYFKKEISRELYEYCLQERWGDANLIAKWKKQGFEKVCCLNCIQKSHHHYGSYRSTCICRVPRAKLEEGKLVQCKHCGCRGCCSGD